jgi:hypothetical protein
MTSQFARLEAALRRHAGERAALLQGVLQSPGTTDTALREKAFSGVSTVPDVAAFLAKVREQSYRITDQDMTALRAAGYSEDAVFELTVAAAIGAADRRLQAGLQALAED